MPIIETAGDAKRLVDAMWRDHKRIEEFRAIRDREMDETLGAFRNILSGELQKNFAPYQSPEPDHEIQVLKHLMASNSSEIEVITTSNDSALGKQPQQLEDALEALDAALFPVRVSLDECDGLLGDGVVMISLEKIPGSPELAKYADPKKLREGAAGITADSTPDDEYDDTPQAQYNRAYTDALANGRAELDPHEVAYGRVTDNARMADGLRWRVRVVDMVTAQAFMGDDPVRPEIGCEMGVMQRNPALKALSNYGVALEEGRWVLTRGGKPTDNSAVGSEIVPQRDQGRLAGLDTVKFWRIRTREETVIFLEHMAGKATPEDPGYIIRTENEFGGKSAGYYILAGNTKLRGDFDHRYDPPILPMLVETQHVNMARSAMLAMAYAEASRDAYQTDNPPGVAPADASQETKSVQIKDGAAPPVAMGKIERIPETGIDMAKVHEMLEQNLDRFRSRELLAGSGSSAETGIHLARLQTQLLTQLTPFQTMRAETRKMILQDFLTYVIESGERCVIPFLPNETAADGKKVAQPREITPKLARLPVVLRYTIGADTPESKYARIQMSQQQTEFGTISMQTHMENSGVKDPASERRLIAKDSVRTAMQGTAKVPGFLGTAVTELLQQYVKAGLEARLGPMPQAPPAPGVVPGAPPPGVPVEGGGQTPVQTAPSTNGVPIAPGAAPMPA